MDRLTPHVVSKKGPVLKKKAQKTIDNKAPCLSVFYYIYFKYLAIKFIRALDK